MSQALPRKLRRAFVLQAAIAGLVIVLGIAAMGALMLNAMISARLHSEAGRYWDAHAEGVDCVPRSAPDLAFEFLPAGMATAGLPEELRNLPPGVHALAGFDRSVLVDARAAGTLYVDMSFRYLRQVFWTWALALMLAGLAVTLLLSWLTYRTASRLVAPVSELAAAVSAWEPGCVASPEMLALPSVVGAGREVGQLGRALAELSARVRAFVERERDFTRDASHELRTPLTVIRVATDMLLTDPSTPERSRRSLHRIQRAGRDMEEVIDAFLILAREGGPGSDEEFSVRDVVLEEIDKAQPLVAGKPVELRLVGHAEPVLRAPPRVLGVMLGNLLANACTFTERGTVEVELRSDRVLVRDTGIGMSPAVLAQVFDAFYRADRFTGGKGMGLSIVRRLGERFHWPVRLESAPGVGTTAEIRFNG